MDKNVVIKSGDLVLKYRAHPGSEAHPGGGCSFRGFGEVAKVGVHHIVLTDGSKWRVRGLYSTNATRTRGIGLEGDQIALDTPEARVRYGAPRPRPAAPPAAPPPPVARIVPAAPDQAQRDAVRAALEGARYKLRFANDGGQGIYIYGFRDERIGGFYWSTMDGNQPLPMAKTPARVCRLINEAWDRAKPAPKAPEPPPAAPPPPEAPKVPGPKDFDANNVANGTRVQFWNNSSSGFLDGTIIERHETPAIEGRTPPPRYDIRRGTGQMMWKVAATRLYSILALPGVTPAKPAAPAKPAPVSTPEAPSADKYGARPWLRAANQRRQAEALARKGS